jgi:hypothetical protein
LNLTGQASKVFMHAQPRTTTPLWYTHNTFIASLAPCFKDYNGGVERSRSAYTQSFAAFDTWAKKLITSNMASRHLHMNTMVQERGLNKSDVQAFEHAIALTLRLC